MTRGGASDLRARLARTLGDGYVLGELLGRGGFAEVWKAHDQTLDRDVAVKVLRPELAADADVAERFLREARAMARLAHPHIVQIHATGETDGLVWVAMQFVDGESLRARLEREGALTADEARRILDQAAQALGAAHAAGIIHRDVKPDNILLDAEGRVLLTDFGIARAQSATSQTLTGTGLILGTPHYMSPEQGGGEDSIDHRADLYSLGVVGYQLLAGRLPFEGDGVLQILMKHATESPPPLLTRRPDAPPVLVAAIDRCLRKRPDDRWASAADFRESLYRASGPVAIPVGSVEPAVGSTTRVRRAVLIAVVPAVLGIVSDVLLSGGGLLGIGGVVVGAFIVALAWGDAWRTPDVEAAAVRGQAAQRLRADRAAVLAMLTRIPRSERDAIAETRRAMDDLVGRADELEKAVEETRRGRADEESSIRRARLEHEVARLRAIGAELRRAVRRVWSDGYARAADDVAQALANYMATVRREA